MIYLNDLTPDLMPGMAIRRETIITTNVSNTLQHLTLLFIPYFMLQPYCSLISFIKVIKLSNIHVSVFLSTTSKSFLSLSLVCLSCPFIV